MVGFDAGLADIIKIDRVFEQSISHLRAFGFDHQGYLIVKQGSFGSHSRQNFLENANQQRFFLAVVFRDPNVKVIKDVGRVDYDSLILASDRNLELNDEEIFLVDILESIEIDNDKARADLLDVAGNTEGAEREVVRVFFNGLVPDECKHQEFAQGHFN